MTRTTPIQTQGNDHLLTRTLVRAVRLVIAGRLSRQRDSSGLPGCRWSGFAAVGWVPNADLVPAVFQLLPPGHMRLLTQKR